MVHSSQTRHEHIGQVPLPADRVAAVDRDATHQITADDICPHINEKKVPAQTDQVPQREIR